MTDIEIGGQAAAYLDQMVAFLEDSKMNPGFYKMVREVGREWNTLEHRPGWVEQGPMKQCFMNAANLAMDDPGLTYVEGYASHHITTEHAWCVTEDGDVIDPTWEGGRSYYGIAFDTAFLIRHLGQTGYYGLFGNDWEFGSQILKRGLIMESRDEVDWKVAVGIRP